LQLLDNSTSTYGGAIDIWAYATVTATTCNFRGNDAQNGGAFYLAYSNPGTALTLTGCILASNTATASGGGVF